MKEVSVEKIPSFVPVGAIAFFITLVVFFAFVWFGFYALMLLRQNG